jgi:cell division protein FtsL
MLDGDKLGGFIPGLSLHRVVVVASIFVIVYSGFTIAGNVTRTWQLNAQTQQLEKEIAQQQSELAQLNALKSYMQSDAFISAQAREEGLASPGDTAIVVKAPTSAPAVQSHQSSDSWWERYYGR